MHTSKEKTVNILYSIAKAYRTRPSESLSNFIGNDKGPEMDEGNRYRLGPLRLSKHNGLTFKSITYYA